VAARTWAVVRVVTGGARLTVDTTPPIDRHLATGDSQAIPPGVMHRVEICGPVLLAVDFHTRSRA
jgi:hypothetical protein